MGLPSSCSWVLGPCRSPAMTGAVLARVIEGDDDGEGGSGGGGAARRRRD